MCDAGTLHIFLYFHRKNGLLICCKWCIIQRGYPWKRYLLKWREFKPAGNTLDLFKECIQTSKWKLERIAVNFETTSETTESTGLWCITRSLCDHIGVSSPVFNSALVYDNPPKANTPVLNSYGKRMSAKEFAGWNAFLLKPKGNFVQSTNHCDIH